MINLSSSSQKFEEGIKDWMMENSWKIILSSQSQSLSFTPGDLFAVVPQ